MATSPLTKASKLGQIRAIKMLIDNSLQSSVTEDEVCFAILEAANHGHLDVIDYLFDLGVKMCKPKYMNHSQLTKATSKGRTDVVTWLLQNGVDVEEVSSEGYTAIMIAARDGLENIVVELLPHGALINTPSGKTRETPLSLACKNGHLFIADLLLQQGAILELGGLTPLMEAAKAGHLFLVKYLIEMGADVSARTADGHTALTYASKYGHMEILKLLLTKYGEELSKLKINTVVGKEKNVSPSLEVGELKQRMKKMNKSLDNTRKVIQQMTVKKNVLCSSS